MYSSVQFNTGIRGTPSQLLQQLHCLTSRLKYLILIYNSEINQRVRETSERRDSSTKDSNVELGLT